MREKRSRARAADDEEHAPGESGAPLLHEHHRDHIFEVGRYVPLNEGEKMAGRRKRKTAKEHHQKSVTRRDAHAIGEQFEYGEQRADASHRREPDIGRAFLTRRIIMQAGARIASNEQGWLDAQECRPPSV